jgi:formate dehydrogenase subunit delta
MDADNLVRMANRIGQFFEAMPDAAEAAENVAQHLKKFWDPRMRRALLAHVDRHGVAGLNAMVEAALTRHRAVLD